MPTPTSPEREAAFARAKQRVEDGESITAAARAEGVARSTLSERLSGTGKPFFPLTRKPVRTFNADGLTEEPDEEAEIPVFVRDYSDSPHHRPYPIGDLHIGAPQFASKALDQWLTYLLETPNVSMLNTGDNTNCALTTSVSDTYAEKLTVGQARRLQTAKFRPLAEADKIDAIIDGNHELRVYRATGDSPNAAVAETLGVNYTSAACIVRYLVGDESYDVYLRHGKGGGSTMGAAVNRLEKQERIIDADVYVSGHTHTQVAFPKNRFVPNGKGGFRRKKSLFVCSGSFLAYEDYAAEAGYAPAHIGAPRIFLDGRTHDVHVSV